MNFKVNREDFESMMRVIKAAEAKGWYDIADRMTSVMDLSACHANGCPLDFPRMEAAIASEERAFDVAHDLGGIRRHIDRETGVLGDCFVPRFAKRNHVYASVRAQEGATVPSPTHPGEMLRTHDEFGTSIG